MSLYYDDGQAAFYLGDVREVLRDLAAESVQCVVTSPPYWGLRDYGTARWDGGDGACDHTPERQPRTERDRNGLTGSVEYVAAQEPAYRDVCGKCGARRIDNQLGLEATPGEYVAAMVDVFREVRRVLRADGTLWLNLGDSYAAQGGGGATPGATATVGNTLAGVVGNRSPRSAPLGLKPKDLVGIPWRVAFALQADGWWLRSDIIWHKPNPMPESVTDRPTKSHEHLFLLAKSERYYYDAAAIGEPQPIGALFDKGNKRGLPMTTGAGGNRNDGGRGDAEIQTNYRNKRDVWSIPTTPFPGAHFATFPPELIKPCILAGCPEGGVVLDPFLGSGTTAMVAKSLGRRAVGIDLNADYLEMAKRRCAQMALELAPTDEGAA